MGENTVPMTAELAAKQLGLAVDGLLESTLYYDDGGTLRRVPSVYRRLRGALSGRRNESRSVAGSKPPLNLHVVDICRRLDEFLKRAGVGGGTEHALRTLATEPVTPSSVPVTLQRVRELQSFLAEALDALGDTVRPIPLRRRCPLCRETFWWPPGADGRKWALTVNAESGIASCHSCRSEWQNLGMLARLCEADT